jgi:peptidoglycan hydrolase CwlO-like protein
MSKNESPNDLRHELANAEAKTRAAQHLLKKAAEEIEDLVEADCADQQKAQAATAAARFRRAASL